MPSVKKADPARDTLRAAITEQAKAQAAADHQLAAVQRAMAAREAAASAVTEAERAVEAAKADHAKSMAGAFSSGSEAVLDSWAVREARLALADAEDRRDAAQSALNQLHAVQQEATDAADSYSLRSAINDAVLQVMKPALADLIRRGIEGRRDFLAAKAAVNFLSAQHAIPPGLADEISGLFAWKLPFPDDAHHAAPDCDRPAMGAAVVAWRQALDALRRDADAPLPEAG